MTSPGEKLLIVLVLYQRAPEQSEAFLSLCEVLADLPEAGKRFGCLIYDNSPQQHALPPVGFSCEYISDPSNPGLARAYNEARERAAATGANWLLLLDHDTAVTREYLAEVLSATQEVAGKATIAAVIPKLVQGNTTLSPQWPNHRRPSRSRPVALSFSGEIQGELQAFNSGAVLRLSALAAIGGFDESFPLDYLDHSTFRQLQRKGYSAYVLRSTLTHELSVSEGWDTPGFERRFWPFMQAEHLFHKRLASRSEFGWHMYWRTRIIVGRLMRGQLRAAYKHAKIALS